MFVRKRIATLKNVVVEGRPRLWRQFSRVNNFRSGSQPFPTFIPISPVNISKSLSPPPPSSALLLSSPTLCLSWDFSEAQLHHNQTRHPEKIGNDAGRTEMDTSHAWIARE